LVKQAKAAGIKLRQSYVRVGKKALIQHQRYAHARQYKRAGRQLRKLKTQLRRTRRDIQRKIKGNPAWEDAFRRPLWLAERVLTQKKRDPLPKVYALHAPEVECIGKGKAHKPYAFGVKVSVATTLNRCKGGQFAIHAKALPGRPYDSHTLETVIPEIEDLTGATLKRILADAGYRGHNAPGVCKLRVFTAGQKRRAAVEPVIGHIKNGHLMDRNFLAHKQGDAINPILAAAGYNFRLILKWIALLWALFSICVTANRKTPSDPIPA